MRMWGKENGMNNHPKKIIIKRRCDVPMKRSKERTRRWKCNGVCKTCICCIVTNESGDEEHINPLSKKYKRNENERLSAAKE